MGFYINQADRSLKSALATEKIPLGAAVVVDNDGARLATSSDPRFDGVADNPQNADWIADEWDEETDYAYNPTGNEYSATGADRVAYGGNEDAALIRVLSASDDVSANHNTVMGVGPTAGKVVEEGYTTTGSDGSTTTYNRENGNFLPIGRVYKDEVIHGDVGVGIEVGKF